MAHDKSPFNSTQNIRSRRFRRGYLYTHHNHKCKPYQQVLNPASSRLFLSRSSATLCSVVMQEVYGCLGFQGCGATMVLGLRISVPMFCSGVGVTHQQPFIWALVKEFILSYYTQQTILLIKVHMLVASVKFPTSTQSSRVNHRGWRKSLRSQLIQILGRKLKIFRAESLVAV